MYPETKIQLDTTNPQNFPLEIIVKIVKILATLCIYGRYMVLQKVSDFYNGVYLAVFVESNWNFVSM